MCRPRIICSQTNKTQKLHVITASVIVGWRLPPTRLPLTHVDGWQRAAGIYKPLREQISRLLYYVYHGKRILVEREKQFFLLLKFLLWTWLIPCLSEARRCHKRRNRLALLNIKKWIVKQSKCIVHNNIISYYDKHKIKQYK